MADSVQTRIGRKLEDLRLDLRLSRNDVARRLGVHHNTIQKWEKGERGVDLEWLHKLAPILKSSVQDILETAPKAAEPAKVPVTIGTQGSVPDTVPAYSPDKWPRDLPVMGIGECGPDGFSLWNGEVIKMALRPSSLAGVTKAYAVYARGDSMEPRYYAGELIYINPAKPPEPGDFVLVQLLPKSDGEAPRAFLKRLVRRSASKVVLEQFSPAKRFEVRPSDIVSMHKVVGTSQE